MQNFERLSFVTDDVAVAVDWIRQGKLIAYPTESVWGLGCDPFNEQAVQALLAIKNRPIQKGLIVLTADQAHIQTFLADLPADRQTAIAYAWQTDNTTRQATTWLLDIPPQISIPTWVRGKHSSLAIRLISHTKIAQLCDHIAKNKLNPYGFLVSTSCNPSALPPAKDFATAYEYFGDEVGYLLGETLGYDKPSQILDGRTGQAVRF